MLKTDLDILAYINAKPDRTVVAADLKAFIGENADARLYEMKQAHLLRRNQYWYDSRPTTYTLGTKGEDLLATHEKEIEQENQRHADAIAEQERQEKAGDKDRHFQLIIAIVGLIGAVVGAFLGAFFQKLLG